MKTFPFYIILLLLLSCSQSRQSNNDDEIYCYDDTIIVDGDTLIYTQTNLIDDIAIDTIL